MCLAVPGKIVAVEKEQGLPMGRVNFGGTSVKVCLALTPDAVMGSYVIVHAGFALSLLNEQEAQKTLALLEEMSKAEELHRGVGDEISS